ncbi:hypothetical protein AQUCO_01500457v1 [Aquilegia coerulea]|uniref:DUF241 domain-containing protein n=1 Tax=Aquilegia coerulea TaxID=218851 RepID=A0A2G5DTV5_AQUCA|nr:hypothetical protein AQUCO_01500457v1 [Aquilegia coerulea]
MVASPLMAKYGYHVRSTSLPSTSHPLTSRVEDELNKLRGWVASNSSSLKSVVVLQDGLCGITCLYESVEDLLRLSHIQQVLVHHRHEKCVDTVLDGSLRLLDVSGTARDVLLQIKEQIQQTQSALRRRKSGKFDSKNELDVYSSSRKKMHKVIEKCLGDLKKMDNKHPFSPSEKDQDLLALITVLREVEIITLSVFESMLSFISGSSTLQKSGGWALLSKFKSNNRIICEMQEEGGNEVATVYSAVRTGQISQKRLEILETSIQSLEEGLENMFRRLIKTRASLLNILSN